MNRGNVPVREGEELEVKIEAVGEKGDGIAKVNGFVLFVPNTRQGDYVKVKITKVLRNVGFAEKVGEAEKPPEEEKPAEEEVAEPMPEEPEETAEDTEDFGEESPEEPAEEEEPSEEPKEE